MSQTPPAKPEEGTIYTHYGTIASSERREHKAAQVRARQCQNFMLGKLPSVSCKAVNSVIRVTRYDFDVSVYELTVCSRAVNHANAKEMVEEKCKPQLDRWRNCFDPATKASDQEDAAKEVEKEAARKTKADGNKVSPSPP
eukprot:562295-Rhodomonas_salina.1